MPAGGALTPVAQESVVAREGERRARMSLKSYLSSNNFALTPIQRDNSIK
jgi:hypothetical protein